MKKFLYICSIFILIPFLAWGGGKNEQPVQPEPDPQESTQTAEKQASPAEGKTQPGNEAEAIPMNASQEKLYNIGFQIPEEPFEAPEFTLSTVNGQEVSLSDYEGSIVFLNFWATWCPPCKKEMPSMQTLYEEMQGRPFTMLAVNLQEDEETVNSFINENRYTFPILLDTSGEVGGGMYGVTSIPTTYILSKEGKILARLVGTREWDTAEIKTIFKEIM